MQFYHCGFNTNRQQIQYDDGPKQDSVINSDAFNITGEYCKN